MPTETRIGWIGAGRMGVPMAGFLLEASLPLAVYSRTSASRQKLVARGARETHNVAECVRDAQVVFSSVADDAALREIALGPDGVLANAGPGTIFVETSTVSSEVSLEVATEAERTGVAYLRAPISGNAASARTGNITVLVSGPSTAFEKVKPLLAAFSTGQVYLGEGDEARVMKLVVNSLVVNLAQSLAEALTLGRKAGLDWDVMLDALGQSALASPWLKVKVAALKKHDYTATASTRLIVKDIDLMLAAARANEVAMPLTAVTRQLMQVLIGAGFGEADFMAAVKLAQLQAGLTED
jgi:3-hydroxyisobutyrate dehydrogenase-like beta-hydroxyacid dehydrogenase